MLPICAGNSPVTGEFPAQRPVTRNFDVFFDLRLNESWVNNGDADDLRRHRAHYDVTVKLDAIIQGILSIVLFLCRTPWWSHGRETHSALLEDSPHKGPAMRSYGVFIDVIWTSTLTVELFAVWDAITITHYAYVTIHAALITMFVHALFRFYISSYFYSIQM